MKITAIKTFICHAYRTNWVFVKVLTDQPGLHGVGEATLEYRELTVAQACAELEEGIVPEGCEPEGEPAAASTVVKSRVMGKTEVVEEEYGI